MNDDSIFSGVSAHSGREVASELHGHQWFAPDENFLLLVGAVTSLARTVEEQAQRLTRIEQAAEPEQGDWETPGLLAIEPEARVTVDAAGRMGEVNPSAETRLQLLLVGLAEIENMIRANGDPLFLLAAVQSRVQALREIHERAMKDAS